MHCSYMNEVLWEICSEIYIGRFGVGWEMQFTKSNRLMHWNINTRNVQDMKRERERYMENDMERERREMDYEIKMYKGRE